MPFIGWGALLLGLIVASTQSANALTLLITSILFNFYSLIVVVWVFLVIVFDINMAPMKHAVPHPIEPSSSPNDPSPWLMIAPYCGGDCHGAPYRSIIQTKAIF